MEIRLQDFKNPEFSRGRPALIEAAWMVVQWLLVSSWIPGAAHRRFVLRLFGARIGAGVNLKPRLRVKFPWRLTVGAHSWIGEDVWIDNLAPVTIGSNCCLSQGAFLCTGSHDWSSPTFDLITRAITIEDGAWIAARASVGPGVVVGQGAVLTLGGVALKDVLPWSVNTGVPAVAVSTRRLRAGAGASTMPIDTSDVGR